MTNRRRRATTTTTASHALAQAVLALVLVSCTGEPPVVACTDATVCDLEPGGRCLPSPAAVDQCAYPAAACGSGLAWSPQAGDLAGACVTCDLDVFQDPRCALPDAPVCEAQACRACASDLECAGGTCSGGACTSSQDPGEDCGNGLDDDADTLVDCDDPDCLTSPSCPAVAAAQAGRSATWSMNFRR